MKQLLIVIVFAVGTLMNSCGQKAPDAGAPPAKDSVRSDNQYTCPMHPDVLTGTPGDCPKCGMELHIKS